MKEKGKISTGIKGLDEILKGGLFTGKSYLIKGGPGTGKSSFSYHFLKEGLKNGESVLYISLGESEKSNLSNALNIGMDLSETHFLDLTPGEEFYRDSKNYNVFEASEVEQQPMVNSIVEAVEKHKPTRVVLDSITMLNTLSQDSYQMRNLALSFIQYICNKGATLLITSEVFEKTSEKEASFWVDGIIHLEYTPEWRRLSVSKYRGSDYISGNHAFRITETGVKVFTRLLPKQYNRSYISDPISTGIEELDKLLHGGIEKGTVTIVSGPTGVGKTNFGIQFAKQAASRGERSAIYTFEESSEVLIKRSESINVPVKEMIENGNLVISSVEPLSYSPDEFISIVKKDVEENETKIVIIDSVGGYGISIREENKLERLHALAVYLQNMGVTSLFIHETTNITGQFETTGMNASYLADNIVFLRYLEINGELRKAIGVLKKRMSDFERTIREFEITKQGIIVGEKLINLRGILTGQPEKL